MNNDLLYVGIDAHKFVNYVALIPEHQFRESNNASRVFQVIKVANNKADFEKLRNKLRSSEQNTAKIFIGIDSCGLYSQPLTEFIQSAGFDVYYMSRYIANYAKNQILEIANKNDTLDAIRVAYSLFMKNVSGDLFKITNLKRPDFTGAASRIHTLVLQRQQYVKLKVRATNQLRSILAAVFPEGEAQCFQKLLLVLPNYPTPREMVRSHGMKRVHGVSANGLDTIRNLAMNTIGVSSDNYRNLIINLCQQYENATKWIENITSMIASEVLAHPYGEILRSFPGVGIITSATIIGTVGDVAKWPSEKQMKKAFGVYPVSRQSGISVSRNVQGTSGDRGCKAALYRSVLRCIVTRGPDNDFRDYYLKKKARGKSPMSSIVSTMGKMIEIMYYCLKSGKQYEYQGIYKLKIP